MADKRVISATLTVDTGNSNQEIKEVNANLKDVKGTLAETSTQATKTGKDIDNSTGSFTKLKGQIGQLPGPLGAAQDGIGKVGGAFKALLANPVVLFLTAIVAALALIYKAFTNTFEGGQKVEQVFAGIKAAGQALIDNLEKVGSAIVKVFKFDFSGAIKDIKGVVDAATDGFNAMAKLTKEAQGLKKEQLANDLDGAKRAKELAEIRAKATDESVPLKERIALIKQLKADAEQNAKDDIDLGKRVAENRIAQLTLEKDGALKNAEEITKIKIEQINSETANANELRNIGRQLTSAEKQQAAERKALVDEQEANAKKRQADAKQRAKEREELLKKEFELESKAYVDKIKRQQQELANDAAFGAQLAAEDQLRLEAEVARMAKNQQTLLETKRKLAELNLLDNPDSIEAKSAKIDADLQLELSKLAEGDIQRQVLAKKASDDLVKIKEEEVEAKEQLGLIEQENNARTANAIADTLGTLSEIAGKQTAVGKGLAIAQATIATYQSAVSSFNSLSSIPIVGPALGAIAAAGAIALGIANVKKILAVKVPGGSGGSAPTPTAIPAAPIAPTASSTRLDQTSLNSINNAAIQPARAYVVETDGANATERASRLNRAARLGG